LPGDAVESLGAAEPPPSSSSGPVLHDCPSVVSLMSCGDSESQESFALEVVDSKADSTCVAVIVPLRDLHVSQQRTQHLSKFIPHMHVFLGKLVKEGSISSYHIYVVEQSKDGRKFNRGKPLNIGFEMARKSGRNHDVFIFHDVDLLPDDNLVPIYATYPTVSIHIGGGRGRYPGKTYLGGVVSLSANDYERTNGYPNSYWGWGGEDDEMRRQLESLSMKWECPAESHFGGKLVDLEELPTMDEKMKSLRNVWLCQLKWEARDAHRGTWKINGLHNLKYKVGKFGFDGDASTYLVDTLLNGDDFDGSSHENFLYPACGY